jgi:hemerythrin-like metal-binding protein
VNLSTDLVTGIATIDTQHAALINSVNKFYDDIINCATLEEEKTLSGAFLLQFVEYAQKHFAYEKDLLIAAAYPGFHEHQQEHGNFQAQTAEP